MKKLFYIITVLLLASCATQNDTKKELIILSTNDMHAKIDNYDKVAAYFEKVKKENKNVLILSAGDMFSGNPIVDQYSDKGYPMIDIMNKLGYQYGAFGNHEFDYGQEILNKRIEQAKFKMLCANFKCSEQAVLKQPEPYAEFEIDGIKICILATIQVDNHGGVLIPSAHPARLSGIVFEQPVDVAQRYKNLRKNCDLFIGLTHNGVDEDVKLANKMPELDIIVGGHSHTRIDTGMVVNGVLISQTECYLQYIGKTTITFNGKKVASKKFELIKVKDLTDKDETITNLIAQYNNNPEMNRTIGKALYDFVEKENLGSLMTDAITSVHHLDFAFQNAGGVRIKKLEKGDITISNILALDPFGNEVIVFEMTPAEIKSLIMNTYHKGSKYADLLVSGMSYTIKTNNGKAVDVIMKDKNGKSLDANKKYKVGMNSYISSSYKFDHADEGHSLNITSAETLIEYIKGQKEIRPTKRRTFIE